MTALVLIGQEDLQGVSAGVGMTTDEPLDATESQEVSGLIDAMSEAKTRGVLVSTLEFEGDETSGAGPYSSVTSAVRWRWTTGAEEVITWTFGPDESLFLPDGETVNTAQQRVLDWIAWVLAHVTSVLGDPIQHLLSAKRATLEEASAAVAAAASVVEGGEWTADFYVGQGSPDVRTATDE